LAQLQGSIDDEGMVEVDLIEPGMRLMLVLNNRSVTTSRVVGVHVDQPRQT